MADQKRETVQLTIRVPPDLRRRLRQVVFDLDTSVQVAVEEMVVLYVQHHEKKEVRR
jgi:predicted transcriptional regulator